MGLQDTGAGGVIFAQEWHETLNNVFWDEVGVVDYNETHNARMVWTGVTIEYYLDGILVTTYTPFTPLRETSTETSISAAFCVFSFWLF